MHSAYLAQLRTEMISALRLAFSLLVSQAIAAHFAKAQIDAFSPLLTPVTSFEIRTIYSTLTKPTVCFVTNGQVSACRRRRGVLEEADFINPSQITNIETSLAPDFDGKMKRSSGSDPEMILSSSFDTKNDRSSLDYYRQLMSSGNLITVGPNCGGATLDFSQFMESCLGVTVQKTTTLTATFTATTTWSYGFTTMTVAGCTPAGFERLYPNCHDIVPITQYPHENTTNDYFTNYWSHGTIEEMMTTEEMPYTTEQN